MPAFQEQPKLIAPNIRRDKFNAALRDAVEIGGKRSAEFLADSGAHLKLDGLRGDHGDIFILTVTEQSGMIQKWAWMGRGVAKLSQVRIDGRAANSDRELELKGERLIRQLIRLNQLGNEE